MLAAETCGGLVWFVQQQKYGEQNGIYLLNLQNIPFSRSAPIEFSRIQIHQDTGYWVNTDDGLLALNTLCPTRREVRVKWVPTNHRYECPICGGKYTLDGTYIEGPARRGLDRYVLEVTTPENGDPIPVRAGDVKSVVLDTTRVIPGKPRT